MRKIQASYLRRKREVHVSNGCCSDTEPGYESTEKGEEKIQARGEDGERACGWGCENTTDDDDKGGYGDCGLVE